MEFESLSQISISTELGTFAPLMNPNEIAAAARLGTTQSGAVFNHSASELSLDPPSFGSNTMLCRICHQQRPDEAGQTPMSKCCYCYGPAGHVHLSCAVKSAETRTEDAIETETINVNILHNIWINCGNCRRKWKGAMVGLISSKCFDFVEEEFPEAVELKAQALGIKCRGFQLDGRARTRQKDTLREMLLTFEEYEQTTQLHVPQAILLQKYKALNAMGLTLLQEDPRQAMLHFEKCPSILIQIGRSSNSESVIRAHMLIAQAQAEMPGTDKKAALETLSEHQQRLFKAKQII